MRVGKIIRIFLLLVLCSALSGCRTRITDRGNGDLEQQDERAGMSGKISAVILPDDGMNEDGITGEQKKNEESQGQTKENPEAPRKEYDENRPAEILAGTERAVHSAGEGSGSPAINEDAEESSVMLNAEAEQTATQTVTAEEAEKLGVSEDAEEADSAATYFRVLLQDRTSSLFECQRLNVYWETEEDHVTVFKTSAEHNLILGAGAYDVSARLLEENLHVDDGWISRKNPGVIVKTVDGGVLGTGTASTGAARKAYADLTSRDGWNSMDAVQNGRVILLSDELTKAPYLQVAAMLIIAKTANPDLLSDVDIGEALGMLAEEATGSMPSGIYYYTDRGGF